ncbi:MAG: DUF1080 domain-containing protein, partial [Planctomycetes bacterium]|nr:DUF1080 domain-containing protein [Planctomycetota bacterium]
DPLCGLSNHEGPRLAYLRQTIIDIGGVRHPDDAGFDEIGNLISRGTFTVFHNGVLIHDNVTIFGPTNSTDPVKPLYMKPLFVQDHGSPVRFRNIWIRPLADRE